MVQQCEQYVANDATVENTIFLPRLDRTANTGPETEPVRHTSYPGSKPFPKRRINN